MKLTEAIKKYKLGKLEEVEILRNPSDSSQWFALIKKSNGKSLILADDNDMTIVANKIESLLGTIQSIGFNEAKVLLR